MDPHRRLHGRARTLAQSWHARAAGTLLGLAALCALLPRCDNGATGEDQCRTIEQARCRAVQGCPGSPVVEDSDVSKCELFYRDECLFGMADGMSPDPLVVDACVVALDQARTCWLSGLSLGQCSAGDAGVQGPALVASANPDLSGCAAITLSPEILEACNFLAAQPAATDDGGSDGSAGGGGGSAGGGGTGGAGGA